MSSLEPSTRWAMGPHPIQGGERGTYVALDTSSTTGMWDRPTRREAQGDGAAVVLRGGKAVHMGKGGRCPETRMGRYARCETPKPSWGSSACGGTLESRVLRKAHARFGEGRMEKCSRSNSPAAYSTSTTAARRGTSSRIGPGSSCPSDCATGLTGSDHWDLVLVLQPGFARCSACGGGTEPCRGG